MIKRIKDLTPKQAWDRGFHTGQKGDNYKSGRSQGRLDMKRDLAKIIRGERESFWFKNLLRAEGYEIVIKG